MRAARHVLAFDPGSKSGAWAFIQQQDDGTITFGGCGDLPVVDGNLSAVGLSAIVDAHPYSKLEAIIEHVGSMPGQGVTSTFSFGRAFGIIEGVIGGQNVPYQLVRPNVWKKAMGLDSDGEKSRALALRMFPSAASMLSRKKDHNRAEAILLGAYALGARKP